MIRELRNENPNVKTLGHGAGVRYYWQESDRLPYCLCAIVDLIAYYNAREHFLSQNSLEGK
jgi:hypothetical protein